MRVEANANGNIPPPHKEPIAAEHHKVAAELMPRTVMPRLASCKIPQNIPFALANGIL